VTGAALPEWRVAMPHDSGGSDGGDGARGGGGVRGVERAPTPGVLPSVPRTPPPVQP